MTVCSTPTAIEVYAGAKAPECYEVLVEDDGLDWRTVTAASALLDRETGTDPTHALTIVSATATTIRLRHTFDSAGAETAAAGYGRLKVSLTIPGGTVRLVAIPFHILPW